MMTHSLQSIREKIIKIERQLDVFKRAEEVLRELATLSLADEADKVPAPKASGTNGVVHRHGAPALIPTVLVKLGHPATIGTIRKNLLGHRVSKAATWTALTNLVKEGAIKRVARGMYEVA